MNPALVIIPTYNERENLGPISAAVLKADPRVDILVVDKSIFSTSAILSK